MAESFTTHDDREGFKEVAATLDTMKVSSLRFGGEDLIWWIHFVQIFLFVGRRRHIQAEYVASLRKNETQFNFFYLLSSERGFGRIIINYS